jgi:hypothetical protein
MIGKDEKINRLYLKLKTVFVTFFQPLSKLGEQVKIRLFRSFKSFILKEKVLSYFFLKIACATNLAHKKGVRAIFLNNDVTAPKSRDPPLFCETSPWNH